jgi:hypothetical protein
MRIPNIGFGLLTDDHDITPYTPTIASRILCVAGMAVNERRKETACW